MAFDTFQSVNFPDSSRLMRLLMQNLRHHQTADFNENVLSRPKSFDGARGVLGQAIQPLPA